MIASAGGELNRMRWDSKVIAAEIALKVIYMIAGTVGFLCFGSHSEAGGVWAFHDWWFVQRLEQLRKKRSSTKYQASYLYPIWRPRGLFFCHRSPPPRTPIRLGGVPLKVVRNLVGEALPRAWLAGNQVFPSRMAWDGKLSWHLPQNTIWSALTPATSWMQELRYSLNHWWLRYPGLC